MAEYRDIHTGSTVSYSWTPTWFRDRVPAQDLRLVPPGTHRAKIMRACARTSARNWPSSTGEAEQVHLLVTHRPTAAISRL